MCYYVPEKHCLFLPVLTGLHLLPLVRGEALVLEVDVAVREDHPDGLGTAARVEVQQLVLGGRHR